MQTDSQKAFDLVQLAKSRLIIRAPYWGVLAARLHVQCAPVVETMATDAINLFYAPEFVLRQSMPRLMGTVAHEAEHCARGHIFRLGTRDLELANQAADFAINPDLLRQGFELWEGHLINWDYAGLSFEEIYSILKAERDGKQAQPDIGAQPESAEAGGDQSGADGQGGAGSGDADGTQGQGGDATGQADAGGNGDATGAADASSGTETGDNGTGGDRGTEITGAPVAHGGTGGGFIRPKLDAGKPEQMAEIAANWETYQRQAAAVASKAGNAPAHIRGNLDGIGASSIDVHAEMRSLIDSRIVSDSSFMAPNRRFIAGGTYLPGNTIDGLSHVVFVIDSSGSINDAQLKNAGAEICAAVADGKIEKLTILWADTHVRHVQEFAAGDTIDAGKLEYHGGGGTRFDRALAWVAEHAADATAILYLTDLEVYSAGAWGIEPDCPLIWAVHGTRRDYLRYSATVPFGDCVHIGQLA